ncbi:MAG: hypothetical protein KDD40_08465, partial [Bdellovibrionales bacterium]|nr:hypothetical protein [Bdellovibrionales bacterium]
AQFALTVDPHNNLLKAYYKSIQKLRANNQATLPTTLKRELACNPFLRCADANIQAQLQLTNSSELNVFTQLRSLRNQF